MTGSCLKRKKIFLICLSLVILILIIYGKTYYFGTVFFEEMVAIDFSNHQIVDVLQSDIRNLLRLTPYFIPASYLVCKMSFALWGNKVGPRHLVNVTLHMGCSILLFFIFFKATGGEINKSGILAAIFAVHPINVEPVAWLSMHDFPLGLFFIMTALLAYTNCIMKPNRKKNIYVAMLYVLSLMSQPVFIMFPVLLLVFDYWPLQRLSFACKTDTGGQDSPESLSEKNEQRSLFFCIREKKALFLVSFIWFLGLIYHYSHTVYYSIFNKSDITDITNIFFPFCAYAAYIVKVFFPFNLIPGHCFKGSIQVVSMPVWGGIASVAGLITISVLCFIKALKGSRFYMAGWLWFLVVMLPAVVRSTEHQRSLIESRYAYLGAVGLFVMLIWGAYELKLKKPFNKRLLCIFAVFVILLFTAISAKHVNCWRNTETVFQHAIAAEPDNPALYQAFGDILTFKNEKAKAIQIFSRAIQNGLETFGIYYRLGVLFYEQGKPVKAIENYNKALHIEPDARVHNDIAVALADIQQFDKAIDHLHKSLALNPDYVLAKQNLKRLVNRTGRNKKCQVNTQNGATSGDDHIEEDKKNGCATFIQ